MAKSGYDLDALFGDSAKREGYWVELAKIDFTEEICKRMDELGITRKELAERMGSSQAYVTKVLRGNANFTIESMVKIAKALDSEFRSVLQPEGKVVSWFLFDQTKQAPADLEQERKQYSAVDCSHLIGDEDATFSATA